MAITIPVTTEKQISLEEFVAYVRRYCDPDDDPSVCAAAEMLRALANNRTFMAEKLTAELLAWRKPQVALSYTSQAFTLEYFGRFMVRANIWEPAVKGASADLKAWHDSLYLYDLAHDHNFKFMTVGYHGSGYATKIYRVDPEAVSGKVGDYVPLEHDETTTLPVGKVMFYEEYRDVHVQAQPATLSVSLNLLVSNHVNDFVDQHFFDLRTSTISACPATNSNGVRNLLCRLAQHVGDERTVDALEEVSAAHPAHRVRVAALEALAGRSPSSRELVWRRGLADRHVYVRDRARDALEGGGGVTESITPTRARSA
ncbi:MAG TPA: HEAT repeat domain-containing protein [Polyangiaceae bacterium]|jgi:hypothetical protein